MFDALRGPRRVALLFLLLSGPPASSAATGAPAVPPRTLPAPSPRARKLEQLGKRLGTREPQLENPCADPAELPCTHTALSPFFASLDALATGTASSPTVIAAFGNSLIAGDRIVDILRDELSTTFGAGGRGVLFVDRLAPRTPRVRAGVAHGEWEPRTLGELRAPELPLGLTGIYHRALTPRASSHFTLEGEPRGSVWWLDVPRAGRLVVRVEGHELARAEPEGSGQARTLSFDLPAGARTLDVVAENRDAVVLGVVLQRQGPGIVLDTLGVPSADANLFLRAREDFFREELAQRDPRLMLFILGGNEAKRLERGRARMDEVETGLSTFVRRARAAAPASACLVVGPIDAVRGGTDEHKLDPLPHLDEVIAMERRVALSEHCAFIDLYSAMGGKGSLARFYQAGLVLEDLVHPRGQGLDLLGQLLTNALLRAWVDSGTAGPQATLAPELQHRESP